MSYAENIFSYCVGGLALISTGASIVLYQRTYLPSVRMKLLDELLHETRDIFNKVDAASLFPNQLVQKSAREKLEMLEEITFLIRERTYSATTLLAEYKAYVLGLSDQINKISRNVKKLRWFLISTSKEELHRRLRYREYPMSANGDTSLAMPASDDHYTNAESPPSTHDSHDHVAVPSELYILPIRNFLPMHPSPRAPFPPVPSNLSHQGLVSVPPNSGSPLCAIIPSNGFANPSDSSQSFVSNRLSAEGERCATLPRIEDEICAPVPDSCVPVNELPLLSLFPHDWLWSCSPNQPTLDDIPLDPQEGRSPRASVTEPDTSSRSPTFVNTPCYPSARHPLTLFNRLIRGICCEVEVGDAGPPSNIQPRRSWLRDWRSGNSTNTGPYFGSSVV